jgi:hypothetical protein
MTGVGMVAVNACLQVIQMMWAMDMKKHCSGWIKLCSTNFFSLADIFM